MMFDDMWVAYVTFLLLASKWFFKTAFFVFCLNVLKIYFFNNRKEIKAKKKQKNSKQN